MLLTTNTIQKAQVEVKETISRNIKRAIHVAKVAGEIGLLFIGYVDSEKYKDLVQTKYNRE